MRKRITLAFVLILLLSRSGAAVTLSLDYSASEKELINPFIGCVVWAVDIQPKEQPFTLVYANLTFAELEPTEGVFDFESFESKNHFEQWRAQGKRMIIRFVLDMPSSKKHMDLPIWLYDLTGKDGKYYKTSYGRGYCPNYDNVELISAHAKAITALGDRYDHDPFVAFVELGSLGHWGEWHVHEKAGTMPLEAIRNQYTLPYVKAFHTAKLMMRRPFRSAEEYHWGLFNDMSGEPFATEKWLEWIQEGAEFDETGEESALVSMNDFWLTTPSGGELSSVMDEKILLTDNFDQTMDLFKRSHTSWIGPHSFIDSVSRGGPLQTAYDQLIRMIGYRLRVSKAQLRSDDGILSMLITLQNDGIAPFYFDWPVQLRLTDSLGMRQIKTLDLNLADVLPDMPVKIELELNETYTSEYSVELAIVDPYSKAPGVELAMDVPEKDGWYKLFTVNP